MDTVLLAKVQNKVKFKPKTSIKKLMILKENCSTIWDKNTGDEKLKILKRGCVIGNTEIDERGDSPVFYFFSFGPPYEMKKIKVV